MEYARLKLFSCHHYIKAKGARIVFLADEKSLLHRPVEHAVFPCILGKAIDHKRVVTEKQWQYVRINQRWFHLISAARMPHGGVIAIRIQMP